MDLVAQPGHQAQVAASSHVAHLPPPTAQHSAAAQLIPACAHWPGLPSQHASGAAAGGNSPTATATRRRVHHRATLPRRRTPGQPATAPHSHRTCPHRPCPSLSPPSSALPPPCAHAISLAGTAPPAGRILCQTAAAWCRRPKTTSPAVGLIRLPNVAPPQRPPLPVKEHPSPPLEPTPLPPSPFPGW
uniref:Uncharacterized protein n=1 Tax=Setaria viridis TaxID=4556 RepID=A0A4U6VS71_SETVI|nr:hypothetical protein SEVIR_2G183200v2 [Setaria viridis]